MPKRRVPILICFAVPEEAKPFQKLIKGRGDVVVKVVGMGAKNAEASIERVLEEWEPERVITSGFAGGLNSKLHTGEVIFDADEGFGEAFEEVFGEFFKFVDEHGGLGDHADFVAEVG